MTASPLISVDELSAAARRGHRARRPLPDGRAAGGPEEYAAGHVPGAAYVDLDTDLAGAAG